MHTKHYPDLFVTCRENIIMNTGNENKIVVDKVSPFSRKPTCSPLVFDSRN